MPSLDKANSISNSIIIFKYKFKMFLFSLFVAMFIHLYPKPQIMYFHGLLICQQMTGRRLPLVWLKIVQVQPMWAVNDGFGFFPPLPLRESFKNYKLNSSRTKYDVDTDGATLF